MSLKGRNSRIPLEQKCPSIIAELLWRLLIIPNALLQTKPRKGTILSPKRYFTEKLLTEREKVPPEDGAETEAR